MAGSYCKFCDHRCFVSNPTPGAYITHLATCTEGKAYDREGIGYDIDDARAKYPPEPIAEPDECVSPAVVAAITETIRGGAL